VEGSTGGTNTPPLEEPEEELELELEELEPEELELAELEPEVPDSVSSPPHALKTILIPKSKSQPDNRLLQTDGRLLLVLVIWMSPIMGLSFLLER
jgi:hypothetical protein